MKRIIVRTFKGVVIGVGCIVLLLVTLGLVSYISENSRLQLSHPTGPYKVGRVSYDWTDEARTDTESTNPQAKRQLLAVIWYPAVHPTGPLAPYLPAAEMKAADKENDLLGKLLTHNPHKIITNSYDQATLASSARPFPVVILQPGLGRVSTDYSVIAENLASQGYVVISSSPTYIADEVDFNDGRIVKAAENLSLPDTEDIFSKQFTAKADKIMDLWQGDIKFLMDKATAINDDRANLFYHSMNTQTFGLVGHSFGGAASYQVCKADARCKVAVDLDGTLFGDTAAQSTAPLLLISTDYSGADKSSQKENNFNRRVALNNQGPTYHISIKGTSHMNFSDLALRLSSVMRLFGILGSIDGQKGLKIANTYTVQMLDHYLSEPQPLPLTFSNLPSGVTLEVNNAAKNK